jgi:hypothetical protein
VKFDLAAPCNACPLRKDGTGVALLAGRIRELERGIARGHSFVCHKTAHHDDDGEPEWNEKEQHCGGALAYTLKVGDRNARTVVAIRVAHVPGQLEKIEASKPLVYDSRAEWLKKGSIR